MSDTTRQQFVRFPLKLILFDGRPTLCGLNRREFNEFVDKWNLAHPGHRRQYEAEDGSMTRTRPKSLDRPPERATFAHPVLALPQATGPEN